ncbi:M81 family metallopeptidase [Oleiharenicola lentus]|uniref:M81 family metallopeptidase n=1 Tax=Oleiharenicola lentus TaxID=2508720 RepID=UPI003F66353B
MTTTQPRVLMAGLFQETNGFIEQTTSWSDFKVFRGAEIFSRGGDGSVTDGFLGEAARAGFAVIPTLDAWALPGGLVEDTAFEQFWCEFAQAARLALATGIDAIFLVLHGAMATTSFDDAEGELLRRIRAMPGAETLPIFGVLDLHANVTPAMCRHANGLVAYRENPHIDAKQTGERATALLARCLKEKRVPHMTWCRPPLVWAPPATGTQADPMCALRKYAQHIEDTHAEIWACNLIAGFSFTDLAETGVSLSVVSTALKEVDHRVLEAGARLAWELRELGRVTYPPADEMVASLVKTKRGPGEPPVLLVEPADNVGAGAPGDGTGILRAFVQHRVERALVVINDPLTVSALAALAVGAEQRVAIGGRGSSLDAGPVELAVTLVSRSDGRFELEDAQSHLAAMSGTRYDMGPCAVVRAGGVTILLTSRKTPPFDLGQLRSQGIEPTEFAFIGVKAAVAHKRAYDRISRETHYVDTPGPCSGNLAALPWKKLRRPVWPIDPVENFTCQIL